MVKRFPLPLLTLLILTFVAESVAQNLLITDYYTPVSSAGSFLIGANYNFATDGGSVTTNRGDIGLVYKKFYESQPYARYLDFTWNASRTEKGNYFNADLIWRVKKYIPKGSPFFGSTAFHVIYLKGYERPALDLTLGVGVGRFINVTPLAKAVRIEDFLLSSGQLYDDLPADTMIELGHIIERQREYQTLYGESYKLIWYSDIEGAIRRSGMLKSERISAASILRIDDVLFRERFSDRFYGRDITLGVKAELITPRPSLKRSTLAADITARYSYPLSWRSQINERLTVNTPLDEEFLRSYSLSISSDFSYELTNRIDFAIHHLISREKRRDEGKVMMHNNLDISFIFYVENRVNLTTNLRFAKSTDMSMIHNFVATLNYRIF
jgi:hypothetical protein